MSHERQNWISFAGAAAIGGFVGGVAGCPSADACTGLAYALGGILCGGIAGTIAAAALTFMAPPAWQHLACRITGFVVAAAAAAGVGAAIAALSPG
jgi:hypothetical protein